MSELVQASRRRSAIDGLAVAMMIGLTFSWGLNQVAVKIGNTGFNPVFAVVVRSAIGCVLVYLWCRYRRIPIFGRDGTLWPGIAAGVLFGTEFLLLFLGLDLTTVARGTLMLNTMPFWVLLGGHFLLGESFSLRKFLGLLLAFAGIVMVFSDELSLPDPAALRGDMMCLAAGAVWAATLILIKKSRLNDASAEKTLLYQLLVSTFFVVPFVPVAGSLLRDVSTLAVSALLFQGIVIVAFTYVLWFWLVRQYPASGLSSFAFLSPAFGVLCGWLILDEPISWRIFTALGLIAVGLVIVNRPVRRSPPG